MGRLQPDGMEFEERLLELEKLEYPKPNREFIYQTFSEFAARHPWVGQENIRPRSIAREMHENFRGFNDYIHDYELQRAAGVLLRHLSGVHKVLAQTVPDAAKTEPVLELEAWLAGFVRRTDSSLLDEWERLRDPNWKPRIEEAAAGVPAPPAVGRVGRGPAAPSKTPSGSPPPSNLPTSIHRTAGWPKGRTATHHCPRPGFERPSTIGDWLHVVPRANCPPCKSIRRTNGRNGSA